MHQRLTVRSLLVAAVLATGALVAPQATAAAEQPPGERVPFTVEPVGFEKGFFRFNTEPGTDRSGQLRVTNITSVPVHLALQAVDVGTASQGGLHYGDDAPKAVGRWIELERTRLRLAGGESSLVDLTVRVPDDARGGEHYGAVVVLDEAAREATKARPRAGEPVSVRLLPRIAVAARILLPGKLQPALTVSRPDIETTPTGAFLTLGVDNPGNVRIPSTTGRVTVDQGGHRFTRLVRLGSFVPDSGIRLRVPWLGIPEKDDYRVTGVLRPEGADEVPFDFTVSFGSEKADELEREAGQRAPGGAVGWWLWLAVAGAVALVLLLVVLWRRRRDQAGDRPAERIGDIPLPAEPLVDLNSADEDALVDLPGIGPAAARRIVAHREEYGAFDCLDDLQHVAGFDADRVAALREHARAEPTVRHLRRHPARR